jgi:uncharacterized phage protein gp47/JayE
MPVTPQGFVVETVEEIQNDLIADVLATVDPSLDLSANQPFGQILGIAAAREQRLQELVAVAYNANNPDAADGFALESVSAITGTTRQPATRTRVLCTCNLNSGFTAAAQAMVANVAGYEDVLFRNEAVVPPVGVTGNVSVWFEAVTLGAIQANAGTLSEIYTPLSGWNSITNAEDATPGLEEDTDERLRQRREDELTSGGSSTIDAIRADVLQVPGVLQCYVFENLTDAVVDGLPPRSIEVLVYDGLTPTADDDAIAQVIWTNKGSGVQTYGSVSSTVYDSGGKARIVKFTRATTQAVYLTYEVEIDPATFPENGDDLIKAAARTRALAVQVPGVDVIALAYKAAALTVPGVYDVTSFFLGFAASPTSTGNLSVSDRSIATIDTADVVVSHA